MAITATLVKELRERTGAGMMECKKALVETDGNIEQAIENMRKSGQAKAAKKAGRVAAEGIVLTRVSEDNKRSVVLEINSETDFVARDASFLAFAEQVSSIALDLESGDMEALAAADYGDGNNVETARQNLIAKIGENINVRRFAILTSEGCVAQYTHGGRIGVLVSVDGSNEAIAKDVAMHVAAANPMVLNPEDVPEEEVNKEKAIFTAQAKESGKPDEIIEKMITGRMKKFVNEIALVGQAFVKDPSQTVGKMLDAQGVKVVDYVRFEVGEGIEKKEEDFAAEVMAQVKGN